MNEFMSEEIITEMEYDPNLEFTIIEIPISYNLLNALCLELFNDFVFNETMEARCEAKVGKVEVKFLIQDKSNAGRLGNDLNHGARVKVKSPSSYISKKDGDPIIVPKTKNDDPVHLHGNKIDPENAPEQIDIVKDIVKRCQTELNVIWAHPDNPKRQAGAIKRIINKCPEIVDISLDNKELEKNLKEKIANTKKKVQERED